MSASPFPEIDLARIPFSMAGSFLTLNRVETPNNDQIRINTVRREAATPRWQPGSDWSNEVLDFVLLKDGKILAPTFAATPASLALTAGTATVVVVFADPHTLLFDVKNCTVRVLSKRKLAWMLCPHPDQFFGYDPRSLYYLTCGTTAGATIRFQPAPGGETATDLVDQLEIGGPSDFQITLRLTPQEDRHLPTPIKFASALAARTAELQRWLALCPPAPARLADAAQTAWYLSWNLQVAPTGHYTRQTILSSKRSMSMIWSWDNCFNALAVVHADPQLAWDQLLVILDNQAESGVLPDCINDATRLMGYNKPPIFALTAQRLLAATSASERGRFAGDAYPKLVRFQNWWLRERDLIGNGVIYYMHGNDSGWDNATLFDERWPVASPDLAAFLLLGAEALGEMAAMLGLETDAAAWREQAVRLTQLFHRHFIRGTDLIYHVLTPQGPQERPGSTSLLTRIPLLLGHRLPADVMQRLIADLTDEKTFLAPYGPASEALNSPHYLPNGYWRGPIWGPSTYLIFEGLLASGAIAAAREVAERYCRLCSLTAIFSENYNAITGADQYDSGMTWSGSDFLLLARWLAEHPG